MQYHEQSRALPPESVAQSQDFASELVANPRRFVDRITRLALPEKRYVVADLLAYAEKADIQHLILLDQRVADIETLGTRRPYGYEYESGGIKITVIDHHVEDAELAELSTGNLARRYLAEYPEGPPANARIALTHGDCDSVLSACMMIGALPPDEKFGEAVLAADHTFIECPVADLLQAIEVLPEKGQLMTAYISSDAAEFSPSLELSLRNLGLLLQGEDLDPEVQAAVDARYDARHAWPDRIRFGQVHELENSTYTCVLQGKQAYDPCPEFLKPLLPDARVILVFHRRPDKPDFIQVRALTGQAATDAVTLANETIISQELVPGFGGRKDAGSNRRGEISFEGDPWVVAREIDLRVGKRCDARG